MCTSVETVLAEVEVLTLLAMISLAFDRLVSYTLIAEILHLQAFFTNFSLS